MEEHPREDLPSHPPPDWRRVRRLVLGSTSWSRRALLAQVCPPRLATVAPDVDERAVQASLPCGGTDPRAVVRAIGLAKARAVLASLALAPDGEEGEGEGEGEGKTLVVCGDAVVTHDGAILGKPADPAHARAMLAAYGTPAPPSPRPAAEPPQAEPGAEAQMDVLPATTVCSVVVVDVAARRAWAAVDTAEVYFRQFPPPVVDALLADGGALHSAGALRFEHPLVRPLVDCVVGHPSTIMGFSLPLLADLVQAAVANDTSVYSSQPI